VAVVGGSILCKTKYGNDLEDSVGFVTVVVVRLPLTRGIRKARWHKSLEIQALETELMLMLIKLIPK
jgi:hypothetical protein